MLSICVQSGGLEDLFGVDEAYRLISAADFQGVDANVNHLLMPQDIRDRKRPAAFTLSGEDYKRLPAECDGASAALLPWLKKKNFYLEHAEAFEPGALDPALADRIRHDFRLLKPLYAFLQNAMTRTV